MLSKFIPKIFSEKKLNLFTVIAVMLIQITVCSQIIITSDDMPVPGYEMLVCRNFLPEIYISGYDTTGANLSWDFSSIIKNAQDTFRYISPLSSDIHLLCVGVFNNLLDPEYKATVANKAENISDPFGNVQISGIFEFYKKTNSIYSMVGRSTSIDGLPVCIKNIPVDTIYRFPLEYGNTIVSFTSFSANIPTIGYYEQTLLRSSVADAWGTIITPLDTFESLRITSILEYTDSVYYDSFGFGVKIPHTETHYLWLTKVHKMPVFVIEDITPGPGGKTAYWIENIGTEIMNYHFSKEADIFPVPASGSFFVRINNSELLGKEFILYDITGKEQIRFIQESTTVQIFTEDIKPGIYILKADYKVVSKIILY